MSIYVAPRPSAKAMLGPGAAALQTGPMAPWVNAGTQGLGREQAFMKRCTYFWKNNPWIWAAERVISGKLSTVPWHLEDAEDTEVDDEYPNPAYQVPRSLLEKPQAALAPEDRQPGADTRRKMWALTSRHMGVTGNAFWYLDQMDSSGLPLSILYIAPWRMTPIPNETYNLSGWMLDYNADSRTGTRLDLSEVLHFTLEPPEEGFFGIGNVEAAMKLAALESSTISHATGVLDSGGRLAGILSAKDAASAIPDDKFAQIVRDMRTIQELPDAAKRVTVLQGPIDFTPTAADMNELRLPELMTLSRDFLLEVWGVPLSQIGGSTAAGLNSGEKGKYEEAALWQGAINPRLISIEETIQYGLLDRFTSVGVTVELEVEEPQFDDEAPRYDLALKAIDQPLRNWERREILGKEPFGDPALDNAVWMPAMREEAYIAPDENGKIVPSGLAPKPVPVVMPAPPLGQLPSGIAPSKANLSPKVARLHDNLTALRKRIDRETTPEVKAALVTFLDAQRTDIARRLRMNGKPKDVDGWFTKARWDRELTAILERPLMSMAQGVQRHIEDTVSKASPAGAVEAALSRGATRIVAINQRTRDAVKAFIAQALAEGLSPAETADRIEAGVLLDNGAQAFDELRAETIARTELMDAYNAAALGTYKDVGLSEVQAIDGDQDEECADRDGRIFSIADAYDIQDHPNGTLDWVPVIDLPQGKALTERQTKALELVESMTREAAVSDERITTIVASFNARAQAEAERSTAEAQRPIIVQAPTVNVPPTTVNVEAPVVHLPAPVVHIPPQRLVRTIVEHDANGEPIGSHQEFAE